MDIVDGDNAAEIAGGQRGLMMMLLASERANERIERVARGQEHHCILRFTLCHQSPTPSPPTPLLRYYPLPLLVEAPHIIRHSRTPIFRYRVPSPLAPVRSVFARELLATVH